MLQRNSDLLRFVGPRDRSLSVVPCDQSVLKLSLPIRLRSAEETHLFRLVLFPSLLQRATSGLGFPMPCIAGLSIHIFLLPIHHPAKALRQYRSQKDLPVPLLPPTEDLVFRVPCNNISRRR